MAEFRLDELARRMHGRILQGSPSLVFRRFTIDSREAEPGDLFFAVVGTRDGHKFVVRASESGAAGAVVSADVVPPGKDFALIKVGDTVRALQDLAHSLLHDGRVKVVGITGSVGKTTTKEFTARILASKHSVLKSEKNFNNHLGLALSLLRLEPGHDVAVLEMGMSSPGEIAVLARVAPPDVAVITNIRPVHLEFFKDLDGIALAKKEILDGTKTGGTAVLNGDDPMVRKIAASWPGRKIFFGRTPGCEVRASGIRSRGFEGLSLNLAYGEETAEVDLPFVYDSFIDDFLAAAGAARALSLPLQAVAAQVPSLKPLAMRGSLELLENGVRILDDSYNSNPTALETALKSLTLLPSQRRVAVLGDMLELGTREREFHLEAGRTAALSGWDLLVTVGSLAGHMGEGARAAGMDPARIVSFADSTEAAKEIGSLVGKGDLVLIKGSRGSRMEKIADALRERIKV
ncbi:MAG: UDP-N-acetylmuramoyl-tripeptide--D-alanyl-D-alanine ligase [Candidatus Aminicenantales bacterium]